jgi:hypothetical protein
MTTNYLNLDELAQEKRVLKLFGVEYEMKEMTVEDFIKVTTDAKRLEDKKEKLSPAEHATFMIDLVQISFPDCPREVLMRLSLERLSLILAFARKEMDDRLKDVETVEKKAE